MSKWLSKFTEKPQSPTDIPDIVTCVSALSVSDSPISRKKSNYPSNQNLQMNAEEHSIFDQIHEVTTLASSEKTRFEFEERAAVFEYEGELPRKEAEERAYQLILKDFLSQRYPKILAEFESIIFNNYH